MFVRDRIGAALEQQCVHARERRSAQLDGQFVHLVTGVRPVERQPAQDARQQPTREQELVLVVGLQQRHGQPEQLAEYGQLVVLRGRVAEHFQILLGGRVAAVLHFAAAAAATVVARVRRLLRVQRLLHGFPGIVRHGITGAPEVRRLMVVEARGRHAPVDRSDLLRDRPLLFAIRHHRIRVLVVQVRRGLENVSGHVQRPEIGFQ